MQMTIQLKPYQAFILAYSHEADEIKKQVNKHPTGIKHTKDSNENSDVNTYEHTNETTIAERDESKEI